MRAKDISVAIRPRNPWEAMDLGLLLLREWWRVILGPWIVIAGAVFAMLLVIFSFQPWLAILAFWWLKPAFDRLLLYLFSQSLFASPPGLRETINSLPGLMKSGLLLNLTLLRLNMSRSFHLPVWQLEGLRGQARKERIKTLGRNIRVYPVWLTIACLHLELALYFGPLLLFYLLIPTGVDFEFWEFFVANSENGWLLLLDNAAYFFAVVLIEPLYVAAGFMLYTNRRAHLEAWDIELAFRRLAHRLRGLKTGKTAAALLTIGALLMPLGTPTLAIAGPPSASTTSSEPKIIIQAILEQKELQQYETHESWLPRKQGVMEDADFSWLQRASGLLGYIAQTLRGALWVAVIAGILLLAINYRRWLQIWRKNSPKPRPHEPLETFSGLDLRPESLPGDIPDAARRALQRGEHRLAMGLLYRGALRVMLDRGILNLRASHTEGDILRLAQKKLPQEQSGYIETLTRLWQRTAYGQTDPHSDCVISLCEQWPRYFGQKQKHEP